MRSFTKHSAGKVYNGYSSRYGSPINPESAQQLPVTPYTAPPVSHFLINKKYNEEAMRLFYGENTFKLLGGDHVCDLQTLLDLKKRSLIRKVSLESQWVLESIFERGGTLDIYASPLWGRYAVELPSDTIVASCCLWPHLQSISIRARCRMVVRTNPFTRPGPQWVRFYNSFGEPVALCLNADLLRHEIVRRITEKEIGLRIKNQWYSVPGELQASYTNIAFLYSDSAQWDPQAPTVPLLSITSDASPAVSTT